MANAFWSGGSGSGTLDLLVETAFNREADFALRDMPVWRTLVDRKPTKQNMPGDVVNFTIHKDLAAASAVLVETVDPDAVAPQTPTRVPVTLQELGRATLTTKFLQTLNFTQVDKENAVIVARDMVDSVDRIILAIADTGTQGLVASGATSNGIDPAPTQGTTVSSVQPTWIAGRTIFGTAVQYMRGKKVLPNQGDNFTAVVHPHVAHDLMAANSASAWQGPHVYGTDTAAVYGANIGAFMGASFISTTRVTTATDGLTSAKVYRSYVLGQQALAEAVAVEPKIVVGPVVDKLGRYNPLGWYGLAGWGLFRPESLVRVFSGSSLGTLT